MATLQTYPAPHTLRHTSLAARLSQSVALAVLSGRHMIDSLRVQRETKRRQRDLKGLPEWVLKDIGMSRSDAEIANDKPVLFPSDKEILRERSQEIRRIW